MNRALTPKDYIKEVLVNEIGDIVIHHPYLSFTLICSGIEFLGICLDSGSGWSDRGKSARHFKDAIDRLFPSKYQTIKDNLYTELRCGMVHSQLSGNFKLTELKNFQHGTVSQADHISNDPTLLILDYFYQDFKDACNTIINRSFPANDKMNTPIIYVGKI